MPIFTRDELHSNKLPWMEIDDFEFIVFGRPPGAPRIHNTEQSNGHTPFWGINQTHPDPFIREIRPTYPRERVVVTHGEVLVECEFGRFTLNRRDWVELPSSGARLSNIGNATAEVAHVKGHWQQVIRQEICLFRPDHVCDYHYHDGDEYWMVFRGHFTLNYDAREYAMKPGLMLAAGTGWEHGSTAPEEHFEAIVMAMGLSGQKRDGHLAREMHGEPVKMREVPEALMQAHQLQHA
jgi:quercetin dioxygenase-like cupin family protein